MQQNSLTSPHQQCYICHRSCSIDGKRLASSGSRRRGRPTVLRILALLRTDEFHLVLVFFELKIMLFQAAIDCMLVSFSSHYSNRSKNKSDDSAALL